VSSSTNRRQQRQLHTTPVSHFFWVLAALLALLTLSAGSALIKLGGWNTTLNLAVSVTKTVLVMAVFMHETEARKLTRLVSALGFIWLTVLISLTLVDVLMRTRVPRPW
jgi:cytochrome c oxidase subunit IV